jgi:hypothetical protein
LPDRDNNSKHWRRRSAAKKDSAGIDDLVDRSTAARLLAVPLAVVDSVIVVAGQHAAFDPRELRMLQSMRCGSLPRLISRDGVSLVDTATGGCANCSDPKLIAKIPRTRRLPR